MAGRLRTAFIAASVAWAVLIVAATYLASRAHASLPASALIVGVYAVGSLICHQLPERSYHLWAAQMPVCARCTGIYFGAVAGALASALRRPHALRRSAPDVPLLSGETRGRARPVRNVSTAWTRTVLALAATPTALTLVYEWTTGVMPSHAIRAAAGAAIGGAVAWLVVAAAENQVN